MVVVDNVHKAFGKVQAVRGVSFELRPGQVAGLLGPNGAGKTTTIRMIAGYLLPDMGFVTVAGYDTVAAPASARRRLGYLPESNPLYPEMRVKDFLRYRAGLFGIPSHLAGRAIGWVLERCWLADTAGRRIGELSKGYKQRVGLAAAMLHDPKVVILDEPTNGLDPTQIVETRRLIQELADDRTMLICSHILPEVERLCGRVIIIAGGLIRADGSPADLTRSAAARYVMQVREARIGDADRVHKALTNIPHVVEVTTRRPEGAVQSLGWTEWVVTARPGSPDLREQIATTAQQMGLIVRELRIDIPSLERVFMKVLDEAGGVAGEPGPEPPPEARASTEAAA